MDVEDLTLLSHFRVATWPPARVILVCTRRAEGWTLRVLAHPDGHLEVNLYAPGESGPRVAHFQRITVPGEMNVLLIVRASGDSVSVEVSGIPLKTLASATSEVAVVPDLAAGKLSQVPSYMDIQAHATCTPARALRAQLFAKKRAFVPKVPARPKTPLEQLDDLRKAKDGIEAALYGSAAPATPALGGYSVDPNVVPALAAALRALLCWGNGSPSWNPLLYRIANRYDLSLPVYGTPVDFQREMMQYAQAFVGNAVPYCLQLTPGQELMDLQDHLSIPVVAVLDSSGTSRSMTAEQIILATASTSGSAHYDETVSLSVEDLSDTVVVELNALHGLIAGIADTVGEVVDKHVLPAASDGHF